MAAASEHGKAAPRRRRGRVLFDRQPAGWVEETDGGMAFWYTPEWLARSDAQPVSLALPLRAEPYEVAGLDPFFENLLPEGWLLSIAVGRLKLARGDGFGLLLALCRDCIGAVSVEPWPDDDQAAAADD